MRSGRFGRTLLVTTLVVALLGGCLTLGPTVDGPFEDSTVFERVTPTESWSGPGVRVTATLRSTPDASDVTTISVIRADGQPYHTTSLDPGQSTVVFSLPADERVTIVASNSVNSTTIETLNVTTGGDRVL